MQFQVGAQLLTWPTVITTTCIQRGKVKAGCKSGRRHLRRRDCPKKIGLYSVRGCDISRKITYIIIHSEMVNLKTSRRDRQQVSNLRRRVNNRNARSNDENFEPEELQAATRIPSESPERMNLKEDDNYSQNNDLDDREEEDSSMTPYADRCPSHSTSREQTPNDFTIGSSETFPTSSMAEGVIYSDSTCDAYSLIPTQSQGLLPSPGGMTLMERLLSQFTLYDHMHRARSPADFQNIKIQFQSECTTVGALVSAPIYLNQDAASPSRSSQLFALARCEYRHVYHSVWWDVQHQPIGQVCSGNVKRYRGAGYCVHCLVFYAVPLDRYIYIHGEHCLLNFRV